ncbi:MAG: hypothetical protein IPP98_10170 [Gemmatimonadetes bacterium]|nr:hypothetical protein [Gemmatimonadota bacterium]
MQVDGRFANWGCLALVGVTRPAGGRHVRFAERELIFLVQAGEPRLVGEAARGMASRALGAELAAVDVLVA